MLQNIVFTRQNARVSAPVLDPLKVKGKGTLILLRTAGVGNDIWFRGRQPADDASHKPSIGFKACGYLPSFRASPPNFCWLLNRVIHVCERLVYGRCLTVERLGVIEHRSSRLLVQGLTSCAISFSRREIPRGNLYQPMMQLCR